MVQLEVFSGKAAGRLCVARRFPFRVGRSSHAHLRLEDDGVWDDHLRIELRRGEGFFLHAHADALVTVNGQPVRQAMLKSGDAVQAGAAQFRFWLAPTAQRGLSFREWLVWLGIAVVCLAQIAIIYWLLLD